MKPLVSIIIPVYNAGPYLRECLDSVRAQTYAPYEVICIDDASTDDSRSILEEYAQQMDSFQIFANETSLGPSAARNVGLEHAKGEYIAYLDGDDWWDRRMLETTVARAEETGADIVVFDYWLYFDAIGDLGTYRDQALFAKLDGRVTSLSECPELARFVGVWDRLFRRSFIESKRFRFAEGALYEDAIFSYDTMIEAKSIAVLADHLYFYRRDVSQSITARESNERKHKEDFLAAHSYMQSRLRQIGAPIEVWQNYTWYFMEYALMHQRQTRPYTFFKEFFGLIHDMSCPEGTELEAEGQPNLVALGQGCINPERWVYRMILAGNKPAAEYFYLKSLNQFRRALGNLRWRYKQLRG